MLIGKRISDRYKIISMIGGGGMANVYLARDMILDRDVAIKILRLDFANEQEFIHRFQREAQSATSLNHPNIVNIYDVGEEEDIYYLVMEYVDGMTLKQYIQQYYPISIEKALDIMAQLVSAISHAHQHQIIHRDIKPQNILIDHDGVVKITDFGIAMALSATSITQTNSVLGTVHYLSPEQARGGMATRKSDIYALGIVMFELLTGRLPFSGESAVSIALKHLQTETPSMKRWNPNIPQSVENIVLKATSKDPFQRYDNVDEMGEDIRTALDPERINEAKFTIPEDNEATKAIPIITNLHSMNPKEETIIHSKESGSQDIDQTGVNEDKKKDKKKKKRKWPWIVGGSFVFLIIIAVLGFLFLPTMLGPKEIKVPSVKEVSLDNAVKTIRDANLKVGKKIKTSNEKIPEGYVIKTNPKAGKLVKEGAEIDIYVSSGKEKFSLSDYTGRSYEEVYDLLNNQKLKFKDIKMTEEYSDSPAGTIIEQDPISGDVVPSETVLTFTVSKGLEKISLKDLRDYNEKGLRDYEESTGLVIDMSKEEYNDTVKEGLVISQYPAPGAQLIKGDRVQVVMSKGPKEKPPKTVEKEISIPYESDEEEQKPEEIQIFIEDMNNNLSVPFDTFTITEPTKRLLQFTIKEGETAKYRVMKGNEVILEDVVHYPND
ncbi:Stk1 family PASTA domain-containing Ser/Thr kinase [Heyndrickxia oleronia]|uniref:Stk1 family PASTA domain-containing Ser/Thr kinase n=1 Tax=Heyndrickxia oleronia TaxID=38875 RepID=UPI001B2F50E6|nr:Stk1 family PASTA domain-containing Ser/Thr kinase [Heyndrickxia oleronia]GIN37578.1 serine/threonine-protein kinase PrkC [Heyndrickxia oleronia]